MPDRLKDIYETLEEMQAGGGLGGGGGATDVSALATEVTTATVATNTGATTTAVNGLQVTLTNSLAAQYTTDANISDIFLAVGQILQLVSLLTSLTPVTQTSVAASTTSVVFCAMNGSRRTLTIFNNSNANLFICTGATATQDTAICRLEPYGYYEMNKPLTLAAISGIWDSAHGNASIYEGA